MQQIEPITDYLKRKLREVGAARFDAIAEAAGVNASFIRKFFYGSRENPRVQTIQPLIDYFSKLERGEEDLKQSQAIAGHANVPVGTADLKAALDEAGRAGLIQRRIARVQRRAIDRAKDVELEAFKATGKGA